MFAEVLDGYAWFDGATSKECLDHLAVDVIHTLDYTKCPHVLFADLYASRCRKGIKTGENGAFAAYLKGYEVDKDGAERFIAWALKQRKRIAPDSTGSRHDRG